MSVVLRFGDKALALPEGLRPILESISKRSTFRAADLAQHFEEAAVLALLRYLHGEGFLETLPPEESA
jgi:hypothetical protein